MVSDPSNNKFILKREVLSYFEKYINSRGLEFLLTLSNFFWKKLIAKTMFV